MTQTKNIASKLTDTKKNIKFYWYLFKTFLDDKKTCFMKMNLLKKLLRFVKEIADFFQFILSYAMFPNCKQQYSPIDFSYFDEKGLSNQFVPKMLLSR